MNKNKRSLYREVFFQRLVNTVLRWYYPHNKLHYVDKGNETTFVTSTFKLHLHVIKKIKMPVSCAVKINPIKIKGIYRSVLQTKTKTNRRRHRIRSIWKKKRIHRRFLRKSWFNQVLSHSSLPFSRRLTITVKQNNILFNVYNLIKKKTVLVGSVGKYRIRTSRKLLRWVYERILHRFFWEAKKTFNRGGLVVILTAPRRLRKWIIRIIRNYRRYKIKRTPQAKNRKVFRGKKTKIRNFKWVFRSILLKIVDKKIFNGCRFSKKRRKKRKPRKLKK